MYCYSKTISLEDFYAKSFFSNYRDLVLVSLNSYSIVTKLYEVVISLIYKHHLETVKVLAT